MSVLNQTGEMKRIVDWVSAAYEEIQNLHATWRFLRTGFTFSTIYNTQDYTPAAVSLTDLATWAKGDEVMRIYSSVSDETYLVYCPWNDFRATYIFGTNRTALARPTIYSIRPNNSFSLWALPDAVYTVPGEYYKTAQAMTVDGSSPVFPSRYHIAIVWKALMYYGAYAAADEKYAHGKNQFNAMKSQMELSELEDMDFGEPLA